jgi:putative inorganic carbon (HCO3(-)) transporter
LDLSLARRTALPTGSSLVLPLAVLAVAGLAVAGLYHQPALLGVAAVGLAAAALALADRRVVVPLIVFSLPLEISKLAFPFLYSRADLGGGLPPTSIVDLGRLAVVLAALVWLLRPRVAREEVIPRSPLTLPALVLLALYALSTLYAVDAGDARTETLRLAFLVGLFVLVPFFVRERTTLRWCLAALITSAALLAAVGVYQQVSGHFFWNEGLGLYGERRINTTFADPNQFARLLLNGMALALALWFFVRPRTRYLLLLPALGLCALTLIFTGSRGAWVIGVVLLPLLVVLLPVGRRPKVRLLGLGAAAVVAASLVVAVASPYFQDRLGTFRFGFEALGARPYLVEAGLAMFKDHPLTGVGVGGYQRAFEDDYFHFKDPKIKADVTLSHTSAVTVMSELGMLGLAAIGFLAYRWFRLGWRLYGRADPATKATLLGLFAVSMVVFLTSQTEGRFLEDPYLWLIMGLAVAVERMLPGEPAPPSEAAVL